METRSQQADKIIQDFAFGSGLTGFVPIPLLDAVSLIGLQRLMLHRLSTLYGIPFKKNLGKTLLATSFTGLTPVASSSLVGTTLLKFFPGIGTLAGGMSMSALSSASTYAVGKVFKQHFENGGVLEDFALSQEAYQEAFHEGRKLAKEKRKNSS